MALLPCIECGEKVSTDAVICPKCGAPAPMSRKGEKLTAKQAKSLTTKERYAFVRAGGKIKTPFFQKIAGLFLLILVGVIIFAVMNKHEDRRETQRPARTFTEAQKDIIDKKFVNCLQNSEGSGLYSTSDGGKSAIKLVGECGTSFDDWQDACIARGLKAGICNVNAAVLAQIAIKQNGH
jgi:hypothetical protein